jgi:hypothetical protein
MEKPMQGRFLTGHFLPAVIATALGGAILLSPAPAQALRPFQGNPDTTGVVALDCALVIADCSTGLFRGPLWGKESKWDAQPFMTRVDSRYGRIGPARKGNLYYFTNLSPGRYQLVQFRSTVPISALPGEKPTEKYDTLRFLNYDSEGAARDFLTVQVSPGAVRYVGRLAVVETVYQKESCPGNAYPGTSFARITRDSLSEANALQTLRKAARGTPWEARLMALPDSALHATPMDTTLMGLHR